MIYYDEKTGKEVYKTSPYLTLDELERSLLQIWLESKKQKNKFEYEISKLENEIVKLKKENANLKKENERFESWSISLYDEWN